MTQIPKKRYYKDPAPEKRHYYVYVETVDNTGHFMAHVNEGEIPDHIFHGCVLTHQTRYEGREASVFISRVLKKDKYEQIRQVITDGTFDPDIHCPIKM